VRRSQQLLLALLGLALLGYGVLTSIRAHRLEDRIERLQAANQELRFRYRVLEKTTQQTNGPAERYLRNQVVLSAPEEATVHGRARYIGTAVNVNSIPEEPGSR
jgi:hypothetical protein